MLHCLQEIPKKAGIEWKLSNGVDCYTFSLTQPLGHVSEGSSVWVPGYLITLKSSHSEYKFKDELWHVAPGYSLRNLVEPLMTAKWYNVSKHTRMYGSKSYRKKYRFPNVWVQNYPKKMYSSNYLGSLSLVTYDYTKHNFSC